MQGSLSEFTLAQLLQFFALAERSGTVVVHSGGRESRLLVEGDKVVGWGMDGYDAREPLLACDLMTPTALRAIASLQPRPDTPGLSFVVRNLLEPRRWDAFTQRQLEQDIYPLLSSEEGDFEIQVLRNPPAPLRLSIPINSMILDGSRWESEMEAAVQDGYHLSGRWQRRCDVAATGEVRLSEMEWLVWAILAEPSSIGEAARRLCLPDLTAINAVRRLRSNGVVAACD